MIQATSLCPRKETMIGLFRKLFGAGSMRNDSAPSARRERLCFLPSDYAAIYAIGDVHGCYDVLMEAERRIVADGQSFAGRKLIVLLGDYVDRGSRSRDVLEHLCTPPPAGFARVTLCGNHDDMFLRFLEEPASNLAWLSQGGRETLFS